MKLLLDEISKKLRNFDLLYQIKEATPVSFENNELKNITNTFHEGAGLRVINDNKIGFSTTNDKTSYKRLIDNAIETSRFGDKPCFEFPDYNNDINDLEIFSKKLENLNTVEMIDWGKHYINEVLKNNKELKVSFYVERDIIKKQLINSAGINNEELKSSISITLLLFQAEENNFLEVWDYRTYTRPPEKNELDSLLNNVLELYNNSKNNSKISSNNYKVFFTPKAFSTLLSLFLQSFNGKLFEKGISYFCDKIGKKVFNENLNISDNPFIKKYPHSTNFDGEGVKPQNLDLIKDGIVKNFSLDLQTAGKMRDKKKGDFISNGHARRGYSILPAPGFTNIDFSVKGDEFISSKEDIISSIDNGIIVDQFLGAGQSNVIGGEFGSNVELGFVVKDGKITGRVKDCMIAGNLFEFFNNILKVEDKKYYYSQYLIPGVLFDNISVNVKN